MFFLILICFEGWGRGGGKGRGMRLMSDRLIFMLGLRVML